MKQFKKAAIIGMSVLTAAAVPAVATIVNNNANQTTFTIAQSATTKTTENNEFIINDLESNKELEIKLNNYEQQRHKFISYIIIGSSITLTLVIGCVLLSHKIKKINELNRSIEATREAKFFD